MKIQKTGSLHMLSFPALLCTNVFIWRGDNGLLLIDTGLQIAAKRIIQYIRGINTPLEGIVITHAHGDHIGGLAVCHSAFPQAQVYIGAKEAVLYKEQCLAKLGKEIPAHSLMEGQTIGGLQVIETPGHTDGSISLYVEDDALICGDFMHSAGGLTISGDTRWRFPFPSTATKSLEESIRSAQKIMPYQVNTMYCGHGKPTHDFKNKLPMLIKRATRKTVT